MSSATTLNTMALRLTPDQIKSLQIVAEKNMRENIMLTIGQLTGENLLQVYDLSTQLYCERQVKNVENEN